MKTAKALAVAIGLAAVLPTVAFAASMATGCCCAACGDKPAEIPPPAPAR